MASCSKCNHRAAWRFEEQLLSCQPDATPLVATVSTRLFVRRNCCCELLQALRHTGSGARLECLRHITRDEAQLQACQASSQGAGPKRQRLEVRAHAAALRGLSKSSKPRLRQSGERSGG